MKSFAAKISLLFLLFGAVFGAFGCELIASVDRTRIGGGGAGAGAGGAGGAGGGAAECSTPSQCDGTDTLCMTRTCDAGVCGVEFAPAGPATEQVDGDCLAVSCDGQGTLSTDPDDNDVLDDMNPCTDDTCDNGSPTNAPSASGMACTDAGNGALCDGNGACVECLSGAECTDGICTTNVCVPGTCSDIVMNEGPAPKPTWTAAAWYVAAVFRHACMPRTARPQTPNDGPVTNLTTPRAAMRRSP